MNKEVKVGTNLTEELIELISSNMGSIYIDDSGLEKDKTSENNVQLLMDFVESVKNLNVKSKKNNKESIQGISVNIELIDVKDIKEKIKIHSDSITVYAESEAEYKQLCESFNELNNDKNKVLISTIDIKDVESVVKKVEEMHRKMQPTKKNSFKNK